MAFRKQQIFSGWQEMSKSVRTLSKLLLCIIGTCIFTCCDDVFINFAKRSQDASSHRAARINPPLVEPASSGFFFTWIPEAVTLKLSYMGSIRPAGSLLDDCLIV